MNKKKISVVGLGYIGLPTAAVIASHSYTVLGVDNNPDVVKTINRGELHIVEPNLAEVVRESVSLGNLKAALNPEPADVFIIAVPTPFNIDEEDGLTPNLDFVMSAIDSIAPVLKSGNLIILESTSPVGTTENLSKRLSKKRPDLSFPTSSKSTSDISIAYCPERVLPGNIINELVQNDRIIGGLSEQCSKKACEIYKIFVTGECHITNARTAELTKLTENSCRDVQIAFANEMSLICDELNIDVWELIDLANRHPRINILQPGPGVGGHCIAVDPWFIVNSAPSQTKLIRQARIVNDSKPLWVIDKVKSTIADILFENPSMDQAQIKIVFFGLAFKPDIDDLRESPSLKIVRDISKQHLGKVVAVEPNIESLDEEDFKLQDIDKACDGASIGVLLVDHKEFREMSPPAISKIIDTKGIWNRKKLS